MITLLRSYEKFLLNFTQNIYEMFSLLIFYYQWQNEIFPEKT